MGRVLGASLALGFAPLACAAKEETTPLGYVITPTLSADAAVRSLPPPPPARAWDAGVYSSPVPASDALK